MTTVLLTQRVAQHRLSFLRLGTGDKSYQLLCPGFLRQLPSAKGLFNRIRCVLRQEAPQIQHTMWTSVFNNILQNMTFAQVHLHVNTVSTVRPDEHPLQAACRQQHPCCFVLQHDCLVALPPPGATSPAAKTDCICSVQWYSAARGVVMLHTAQS